MAKGKKKKKSQAKRLPAVQLRGPEGAQERMGGKEYERELKKLHVELVKLQLWVKAKGERIIIVFEGRDAAGKGGVIKAITERVSPRVFRVVALPAPSDRQKSQLFIQRYLEQFPSGGEIVIFDRSWYNRAGVEHVMGYCTEKEYERFLRDTPPIEREIVGIGIRLIKYWFEVSPDEQTRRFEERMTDGRKLWKLSPMDLESHHRWYDYSRARDALFQHTDTDASPWHVVRSDDKRRARLNCIKHLLSLIPYEKVPMEKIKLPKRQKAHGYVEPKYPYRIVPEIS
jgi:polyphosphate kinase 2